MKGIKHDSSHVDETFWNPIEKSLLVVFKNEAQYLYNGVTESDYELFLDSDSAGKGFNEFIRPYPYVKIEAL